MLVVISVAESNTCQQEGEVCSKTIFQRCCDNLVCELSSFGKGKCVRCLAANKSVDRQLGVRRQQLPEGRRGLQQNRLSEMLW
ncbi:hypothetical protein SprV_0200610900 [Sparganum proliferum]